MKKSSVILILIIITYVILRLLLVSSQRDHIFDYNEFFSGTIAMELIRGLSLPLKYCMPDDHSFGSIINGMLTVPFYLFFGPSSGSSKMVSIIFSAGVLLFWYLLLKRFFSQRAALIAGLLFIFSPTIYTKSSVLSMGAHPESNLFTAAIIFIFYIIFFGNRKRNVYFMIFGLTCGFALFYSYQCWVTVLVILLFWFAFDRRFMLRPQFYLFLFFLLIGFSPRFYFSDDIKYAFALFRGFMAGAFNYKDVSFFSVKPLRIKMFFESDLCRLFAFEHLPGFIQNVYYGVFLVSFVSLLWLMRRSIYRLILLSFKKNDISKEGLLLAFPLVFSAVYILSGYMIWPGWQNAGYIVPFYPFIFVIAGVSFDQMMHARNGFPKVFSTAVIGLIILSGFYENLTLIEFSHLGRGFMYKGYSYRFFAERVGSQYILNDTVLDVINRIDYPRKQYFLEGIGWGFIVRNLRAEEKKLAEELIAKKFSSREKDMLFFYKGVGRGLAHRMDLYLYHKSGLPLPYEEESDLAVLRRFVTTKDAQTKRYFWEGFGQEVNPKSKTYQIIQDYIEDEFKPCFYRGIGETQAWHTLDRDYNSDNLFSEFAPNYKKEAFSSYRQARTGMLLKNKKADEE